MKVEELIGRTIEFISVGDETHIYCTDGSKWRFYHEQDCCESVVLDVEASVIPTMPCVVKDASFNYEIGEETHGYTWTRSYFKFETSNGPLNLTWHGSSNGYYSEGVSFQRLAKDGIWRSFYLDQNEQTYWM